MGFFLFSSVYVLSHAQSNTHRLTFIEDLFDFGGGDFFIFH